MMGFCNGLYQEDIKFKFCLTSILVFICAFLMFSNSLEEVSKYIETCRSYDKLCVKDIILTKLHLLVLLCQLHINARR